MGIVSKAWFERCCAFQRDRGQSLLAGWTGGLRLALLTVAVSAGSIEAVHSEPADLEQPAETGRRSELEEGKVAAPPALTLTEALLRAESHNATILNAEQQLRSQTGATIVARSLLLPRIDVTANYAVQDSALLPAFETNTFGSERNWDARAQLRQRLFSGGKAVAGFQQQTLLQRVAESQLAETMNQVFLEVSERYFDVLLARSLVAVREQSTELLAEEKKDQQLRFDSGTVSEFNVLRAEVELANAQTPLIRARNQLELALRELERILGYEQVVGEVPFVVTEPLSFRPVTIGLEQALTLAAENRPEQKRLELLVDAAEQAVRVQQADYLPHVFLTAGYAFEKDRFSDSTADSLDGWIAGAETTWNIFESFATHSRVDQARSELEIARSNYRQARVDIAVEVRQAFALLTEGRQLLKASDKVVEQAEESLRLARRRVEAGAGTQLEVLDSQLALTEARNNAVQALYDYNVAIARLERAMGSRLGRS